MTKAQIVADNEGSAGGSLEFFTRVDGGSSTEKMRISAAGNVGIGTSLPTKKLEVASGNSGGDAALDSPTIRINNTTASSDWDSEDVVGTLEWYASDTSGNAPYVTSFIKSVNETGNGTLPSGALTFGTSAYNAVGGATEAMRIDDGGNVGIGTTSPGAKFTVLKDGTQAASVSTTYQIQTVSNSNGGIAIQAGDSSIAYLVFGDNGDYDAGRIGYKNASHDLCFFTNNEEEMVLDSDGDLHVDRDVVAFSTTPSDKRLKKNIKDIDYGLDTIMKLSPKEYDWKKDDTHDIGFIAQEVEEIIPEIVKDKKHFDKDIKTLDYEKLTAVLIKAVQEQQQQINKLEEKLNG